MTEDIFKYLPPLKSSIAPPQLKPWPPLSSQFPDLPLPSFDSDPPECPGLSSTADIQPLSNNKRSHDSTVTDKKQNHNEIEKRRRQKQNRELTRAREILCKSGSDGYILEKLGDELIEARAELNALKAELTSMKIEKSHNDQNQMNHRVIKSYNDWLTGEEGGPLHERLLISLGSNLTRENLSNLGCKSKEELIKFYGNVFTPEQLKDL